jgi:hypothetical protein
MRDRAPIAYPALEGTVLPELDHEVVVCCVREDKARFGEMPVASGRAGIDVRPYGG